jgi:hypothetical protein
LAIFSAVEFGGEGWISPRPAKMESVEALKRDTKGL